MAISDGDLREVQRLRDDCAATWARLDERLSITEGSAMVNDAHITQVYQTLVDHRDMSFLQRLRWLMFRR